jgi:hypothetical protein
MLQATVPVLEPVCHKLDDSTFPSMRETLGRFVGIAEQVGHLMTFSLQTTPAK